jgi:nitrilase
VEPGNTVIVGPDGNVLAGPVREREETLFAEVDLRQVAAQRRMMDPTGHYNRPDVFRLVVDTSARQTVVTTDRGLFADQSPTDPSVTSTGR